MNVPLNINLQQILLHLFNFLLLFGGLYLLLYKPVRDFMDKRRNTIRGLIEEAEKAKSDADEMKAEYEEKLSDIEKQAKTKEKEVLKMADESAKERLTRANAEAEKIINDARAKGMEEHDRIVASASGDIAALAADAAEKLMLQSMDSTYAAFIDAADKGETDGKQG